MTEAEVDTFLKTQGLYRGPVTVQPLKGGYLNQVLKVTKPAATDSSDT